MTGFLAGVGALVTGLYLGSIIAVAIVIAHSGPWNVQHYSHHRDGRFETFRDHPVRNVFGVALNAVIWPALAVRAFIKEI